MTDQIKKGGVPDPFEPDSPRVAGAPGRSLASNLPGLVKPGADRTRARHDRDEGDVAGAMMRITTATKCTEGK
jgi:hypothetical protein